MGKDGKLKKERDGGGGGRGPQTSRRLVRVSCSVDSTEAPPFSRGLHFFLYTFRDYLLIYALP